MATASIFGQAPAQRASLSGQKVAAKPVSPEIPVIRSRSVELDADGLSSHIGQIVQLNLFDDFKASLKVDQCETFGPQRMSMWGSLADDANGRFVLSRAEDAVVATIWTGSGKVFELQPTRDGSLIARELNVAALPSCECHAMPVAGNGVHAIGEGAAANDECVGPVDVLIVYTQEARDVVGNDSAIRALAMGAIASANIAYANSEIDVRLQLAGVVQVEYEETHNFALDLTRLSIGGDGYLDEVQPLRNMFAADMVSMFVASPVSCGIAFVMGTPSPGFESSAYSVVQVGCAIPTLSFAHELGHNFGCQHLNGDGSSGAFPYSFGHHFMGNSGRQWRTVMASGAGQRVPQFSNPNVLFGGVPTGIPRGLPGEADNARTIRNTAAVVANFRNTSPPDCNGNGFTDSCEIADGSVADVNDNGLPDDCEPQNGFPSAQTMTAGDANSFDNFGTSVAITPEGSRMIVGAELHDAEGTSAGTAYIFRNERGSWVQEAQLIGSDTNPFDRFGHAVAISAAGDVAVVTAYRHAVFWPDAGAAYVFVRSGNTWTQQAVLSATDPEMTDYLGFSAAISADGSRIALGAMWEDQGADQAGAVYVFDFLGGSWQQSEKIVAQDATAGSEFGNAVVMSADGSFLCVGARFDDRFNTNFGAAYVFRHVGGSWSEEAKLTAPAPQSGDRFGWSVAMDGSGTRIVVGSPGNDLAEVNAGAAFAFTLRRDTWIRAQTLIASTAGPFKSFGSAAGISPDGANLVVGSFMDFTRMPRTMGGSATQFVLRKNSWIEVQRLTEFDSASNDSAGSAVAVSDSSPSRNGSCAAVAWPLDDIGQRVDCGSVRVFSLGDGK